MDKTPFTIVPSHVEQLIPVASDWDDGRLAALQASDREEYYVEAVHGCDDEGRLLIKWFGSDEETLEPLEGVAHIPAVSAWLSTEEGRMWRDRLGL